MTENELLSRQYFKEIFILNSLYKKLINFVEDERACRKAGYKFYQAKYWNGGHMLCKSYNISNDESVKLSGIYDGIRIDFIQYLQYEGLYSIQADFRGVTYMHDLRMFYKDKLEPVQYKQDIKLKDLYDIRSVSFPIIYSQFSIPQRQEVDFQPVSVLKYIKNEIEAAYIPGFIVVERRGDKYFINNFTMQGLDNTSKLIDQIITGEIHQGL